MKHNIKPNLKHLILSISILLGLSSARAQVDLPQLEIKRTPFGMTFPFGHPILGTEYKFEDEIENVSIDTLDRIAFVYLKTQKKSKGKLVLFDYADGKVRWSITYDKAKESFLIYEKALFKIEEARAITSCIDIESGKVKWTNNYYPLFVSQHNNVVLCYEVRTFISGSSRALHGINLQTGESVYWNNVLYNNGWYDSQMLNDSTLIIASDGLHSINLKSGKGWHYDVQIQSTTKSYTPIGVDIALNVLRFPYLAKHIATDVTGVCSNILIKDSLLYFAGTKGLFCFKANDGELFWLAPLDEKFSARSFLSAAGDYVSLFSIGRADYNNNTTGVSTGKPFLAKFDALTGIESFLSLTNMSMDFWDSHLDSKTNSLYFLAKDKIIRYSTLSGRIENSRIFDLYEQHPLDMFVDIKLYELDTTDFVTFTPMKNTSVVAYVSANEDIVAMNSDLSITRTLKPKNYYWLGLENEQYKIFVNEEEAILTNSHDRKIAYLDTGPESVLHGNIIYDYFGKSLYKIDLSLINIE